MEEQPQQQRQQGWRRLPVPRPPLAVGGGSLPRVPSASSDADGPFTFTSPFDAAADLRSGPSAAAGAAAANGGGLEKRPSGALRGSAAASGSARLPRNVSWTDLEGQSPLAQVVEYEPSVGRCSTRSEDEWEHSQSGCLCCIQ